MPSSNTFEKIRIMKDFLRNISCYPRFFIDFLLNIFLSFFSWTKLLPKNYLTKILIFGIILSVFSFFYFTLLGMLGIPLT